jgi:hypothetical protein
MHFNYKYDQKHKNDLNMQNKYSLIVIRITQLVFNFSLE